MINNFITFFGVCPGGDPTPRVSFVGPFLEIVSPLFRFFPLHSDPKRQQQAFRGEVWTDDAGTSRFGHLVTQMPTTFQRGRNFFRGTDVRCSFFDQF